MLVSFSGKWQSFWDSLDFSALMEDVIGAAPSRPLGTEPAPSRVISVHHPCAQSAIRSCPLIYAPNTERLGGNDGNSWIILPG